MGHEEFRPRTRVYEIWDTDNSGDVYSAIRRVARRDSDPALYGKHIGLRFPKQMECKLILERNGKTTNFLVEPVLDKNRRIIDVRNNDMPCPDVVLTATDRYGYVTAYTINQAEDYDIAGSITFNADELVAVAFSIFDICEKDSRPWYKRLFS